MTRKLERPLYLDMPFDEALTRYIGTDPSEVDPVEAEGAATQEKGRQAETWRLY